MINILSYFKRFSFIRWLRLTIGIAIIAESLRTGEWIVSLIGVVLLFMVFMNTGCDPSKNTCANPVKYN